MKLFKSKDITFKKIVWILMHQDYLLSFLEVRDHGKDDTESDNLGRRTSSSSGGGGGSSSSGLSANLFPSSWGSECGGSLDVSGIV